MDSFMSDVKIKAEAKLLNTHRVKCNKLLIMCIFCLKNYFSESLLQPTKTIVIEVQKGKRNSRSWLEMKKKKLRSCISHPSPWQQVDF